MSDVQIRFSERPGEVATVIEVHRRNDPNAIQHTDRLLFALRVQILSSETFVDPLRRMERFRVCELDGGPLSSRRKRELSTSLSGHLRALHGATALRPSEHRIGLRDERLQ